MDVEGAGKSRPNRVVDAGEVQVIKKVERLSGQFQCPGFAPQPDHSPQTQVEGPKLGADTGIAPGEDRTVGSVVAVGVDVDPCQQIERSRAAVSEYRCQ